MCEVRSPFSAEGTKVWNYNSIWSRGKNVLLVPEVRRFGVIIIIIIIIIIYLFIYWVVTWWQWLFYM